MHTRTLWSRISNPVIFVLLLASMFFTILALARLEQHVAKMLEGQ